MSKLKHYKRGLMKVTVKELISLEVLIDFSDRQTNGETIASKECKELLRKLKIYLEEIK